MIFLLFSHMACIIVPLLFSISGFLFFYNTTSFTSRICLQKIKKKAITIFLPYIFWNLLVLFFFFMSQTFLPELISGRNKLIVDYSISDWFRAFWSIGSSPICYQFWFIRDLMVVMLFSPLIYFLLVRLCRYAVLCLGVLWLFDWWLNIVGFSSVSFFFFSVGSYFSIHRKNFAEIVKPFLSVAVILYVLITIAELYFMDKVWCSYLHRIGILVGIVAVITLTAHFIEKGKWQTSSFLSNSSFFIYAYHAMPLAFVIKFLFKLLKPNSDGVAFALYVFCSIITIFIGLFTYKLLKKYLPLTTALITGGR